MTSASFDPATTDSEDESPLSYSQRRLWLLEQLQPKSSAHHVVRAFRLDGPLDLATLEASLRHLVGRHEALTTVFEDHTQGPQRRPTEPGPWSILVADYSKRPAELAGALTEEAARPFDLSRAPLFRALVFRLADHHVFLFVVHGAACDESSADLLINELHGVYDALRSGSRPLLRELEAKSSTGTVPPPARWAAALDSAVLDLDGAPDRLEFPTDHPRPLVFSYRGRVEELPMDRQLVAALRRFAAEQDSTLSEVLLTLVNVLLARYSGQHDILVGSSVSCRPRDAVDAVGSFSNTVVVRTRLGEEQTFLEYLASVSAAHARTMARHELPFQLLLDRTNPPRDRSRTPLFQAHFGLRETALPTPCESQLSWSPLYVHSGGAKTDLSFAFELQAEKLVGRLEYATDLFDAETARAIASNFETLLGSALAEPGTLVSRLPLLNPKELARVLSVNDTAREVPAVAGFDELVWAQARRTPERIAVASSSDSLSYGELERRSTQLARYLVQQGVRKGSRVGVMMERTSGMVAAVLGVLKAGAAYVPLDSDYPRERVEYMVGDAELALIVTDSSLRARLPSGSFAVLEADTSWAEIERAQGVELPVDRAGTDIAYVIYTSGTTGRPKGVQVPHGAVANFLASMAVEPGCSEHDSVIAVTTLSFDIAVLELFLPLTLGARTYIVDRGTASDGTALAKVLEQQQATLMQATPTTWRMLIDSGWSGASQLRALCGGEPLPAALARELLPLTASLWNMYGPTETTVWSTCQRVEDPSNILIGKPIANTEVYVVDRHLAQVPFGVIGELIIGGHGVTAGYLNRAELTEERFIVSPFSSVPGARLYRTGDLVRHRPTGIQCLGRNDGQVKIRGHRIELAEIEAVIGAMARVSQCVVEAREFGSGDVRLVAYVVALDGGLDSAQVRTEARARLPEYMVPQHVVELDAMPLTPNGKINRKALPTPTPAMPQQPAVELPLSATEKLLLGIWQEVLGSKEIGTNDNFFDVGGHSLTAVRLIHRINLECQLSLPLAVIFEAPTIAQQAERIDKGHHSDGISVVPLQPAGNKLPLFCICGISLYQTLARQLGTEHPTYGVFLPVEGKILDGSAAPLSVAEMAKDYAHAIRSRQPVGPYCLAGVSFGGLLAYETAQQLRRDGQEVAVLAIMDVILPHGLHFSRARWVMNHAKRVASSHPRKLLRVARSLLTSRPLLTALRRTELSAALFGDDPEPVTDAGHRELEARRQRFYRQASVEYEKQIQPYDGSAVVFVARDEAERLIGYQIEPDCGWGHLIRGDLRHHEVPGDHLGILKEPNVSRLAQLLGSYLRRASALAPFGFLDAFTFVERCVIGGLAEIALAIERGGNLLG